MQKVLQHHINAEREVEREYQEILTTPAKLDSYIKEQEKKLLATHQAHHLQLAQQQAAYNQRYNSKVVKFSVDCIDSVQVLNFFNI